MKDQVAEGADPASAVGLGDRLCGPEDAFPMKVGHGAHKELFPQGAWREHTADHAFGGGNATKSKDNPDSPPGAIYANVLQAKD